MKYYIARKHNVHNAYDKSHSFYLAACTALSWTCGSVLDAFSTMDCSDWLVGFSVSSESVLSWTGTFLLFNTCWSLLFYMTWQYIKPYNYIHKFLSSQINARKKITIYFKMLRICHNVHSIVTSTQWQLESLICEIQTSNQL